MNESRKLLADYADHGSEAAFRELVDRYINMVYSTALRLVNGDSFLAQDISQTTFVNLAHKASTLSDEIMIGGWLHRHTCFLAANVVRGNRRREDRERKAVEMNATEDHSAANFAAIAPLLDEAINELSQEDRIAILLRFFEQREFRAVAETLGGTEDAARMRVNRALEKLHASLTQRGVRLTAMALGTALAVEAVKAAPAGLAASVASAALGGAVTGGTTITIVKILSMTKMKMAIASSITAAILAVPIVVQQKANQALREENEALKQQMAQASAQEQISRSSADVVKVTNMPTQTEEQTRELARLRNEVSQLRGQTNEMGRMRQEIKALSQSEASSRNRSGMGHTNESLNVVGVIRDEDKRVKMCLANLVQLDSAKQQWALEQRKQASDTPTINDLLPYFGGRSDGLFMPICPDGGTYTIGTVGEKPTCTNPKHVLP
jgi:RNA polymerase sigma factor (sigma-70 family)